MHNTIRNMNEKDRNEVIAMMREFYSSEAVLSNGSEEIFKSDFESCISECQYIEGYIFQNDKNIQGYAMVAKSFSTEFGKPCIWIEDLYIKQEYRGLGIGSCFLQFIEKKYPNTVIRLEVEEENTQAVSVYKRQGFEIMPYQEMIKHSD